MSNILDHAPRWRELEPDVLLGVGHFLDSYAGLASTDTLLILYTPECRTLAALMMLHAEDTGATAKHLSMRAVQDDALESRIAAVLASPDVLESPKLKLVTIERNTMSHAAILRRAVVGIRPERVDVLRIINGSPEFFEQTMSVTPAQLSQVNAGLLEKCMETSSLRVTGRGGTDIEIGLHKQFRWLSNRGHRRPGAFVVFPAGEISTYSDRVNGTLVADGAFNVTAFTELDARLEAHPVTVEIEDSRIRDFRCADRRIMALMQRCVSFENGDRLGEIGFGTNVGIGSFIAMNSHINERKPGFHLGFGQHNQLRSVVPYECKVHLDLITANAQVYSSDGVLVASSDRWPSSNNPHSPEIYDEDIDGDCCGLFDFAG
ncbi:MAG: M29 family metallopeptidase [Acidimicrobiales bacterium]